MDEPLHTIVLVLALLVMLVGVAGTVLPAIPGPILILLAAGVYAVLDGFGAVGWPTLIAMGVLALVGAGADLVTSSLGAKVGGASGWSVVAGLAGGLIGLLLFSLPGSIIGAVLAVLLAEIVRQRDWRKALRSGTGWLIGWVLSTVVKLALALTMVAIFVWQVVEGP